jgi:hypothetical protein
MVHVFLGEVQVKQVNGSDAHVDNGVRNLLFHRLDGIQAGDEDFGQEDVNGCVHFWVWIWVMIFTGGFSQRGFKLCF